MSGCGRGHEPHDVWWKNQVFSSSLQQKWKHGSYIAWKGLVQNETKTKKKRNGLINTDSATTQRRHLRWNIGQWNGWSHWKSNPGHLTCTASTLPLSYGNRTTTSPRNPLYMLHRWYWKTSVEHLAATQYMWCPGFNPGCWSFPFPLFCLITAKVFVFPVCGKMI